MTRAKSWLGVVGDPVALCSVGECSRIWRTYLKHCGDLNSILPPEISLAEVWRLVESLSQDHSALLDTNTGMICNFVFVNLFAKFLIKTYKTLKKNLEMNLGNTKEKFLGLFVKWAPIWRS